MRLFTPWFVGTGQRWKMLVFYVLTAVAFFLATGGLVEAVGNLVTKDRVLLWLLEGAFGPIWLSWFGLAFRCPRCRTRIGWWYATKRGIGQWFTEFIQMRHCPVCGFRPEAPQG